MAEYSVTYMMDGDERFSSSILTDTDSFPIISNVMVVTNMVIHVSHELMI